MSSSRLCFHFPRVNRLACFSFPNNRTDDGALADVVVVVEVVEVVVVPR